MLYIIYYILYIIYYISYIIYYIQLPFGPSPPLCLDEGIVRVNGQRNNARWKDTGITSTTKSQTNFNAQLAL